MFDGLTGWVGVTIQPNPKDQEREPDRHLGMQEKDWDGGSYNLVQWLGNLSILLPFITLNKGKLLVSFNISYPSGNPPNWKCCHLHGNLTKVTVFLPAPLLEYKRSREEWQCGCIQSYSRYAEVKNMCCWKDWFQVWGDLDLPHMLLCLSASASIHCNGLWQLSEDNTWWHWTWLVTWLVVRCQQSCKATILLLGYITD